jgi:hypothetical protein
LTKLHRFTVQGTSGFPLDMLRYDNCWPTGDVTSLHRAVQYPRPLEVERVTLMGWKMPTRERWASFGWFVTEVS